MGTEMIGYVIGQQCAPVLAGIKPSNLLIVEQGNEKVLCHVLRGTEIKKWLLYSSQEKDYWLLYDEEKLQEILNREENRSYLRECGYEGKNVLEHLACRFSSYKRKKGEFPHEMGLLFGYPLNDVKGFIQNKGQNFKMSGYWKVYDDVAYAGKVFRLYEHVRKMVLDLCSQGLCIRDICRTCRRVEYQI